MQPSSKLSMSKTQTDTSGCSASGCAASGCGAVASGEDDGASGRVPPSGTAMDASIAGMASGSGPSACASTITAGTSGTVASMTEASTRARPSDTPASTTRTAQVPVSSAECSPHAYPDGHAELGYAQ